MYYLINEGGESKIGRQIQADVIASNFYLDSHLPAVQKINPNFIRGCIYMGKKRKQKLYFVEYKDKETNNIFPKMYVILAGDFNVHINKCSISYYIRHQPFREKSVRTVNP